MSIYEQLAAQVRPVLTHYRDDLEKWDREAIEEKHVGVPFLHWACSSSTHIVLLIAADSYPPAGQYVPYLFGTADREHILKQAMEYAKYFLRPEGQRADGYLVHHYDGASAADYVRGCLGSGGELPRGNSAGVASCLASGLIPCQRPV